MSSRRDSSRIRSDVVVVGSGIAGLTVALGCTGRRVRLLTRGPLVGGASPWAQGGLAAAVGPQDSPRLHARDTLTAAAGLAEPAMVDILVREAPVQVARLLRLGTRFDLDPRGELELGREAAHSRRRILHARGDSTGREIVRALVEAVRRDPRIDVWEGCTVVDLVVRGRRVIGVRVTAPDGSSTTLSASAVVLATGGIGRLFRHTTNPAECGGEGLAMAARAGARLVDLEFVQFHPTALKAELDPLPLLTEALRGEGAVLVDEGGRRFMPEVHPSAELAPRDVVARAVWGLLEEGKQVFLDATSAVGRSFPDRFPTVFSLCRDQGIDPRVDPLPVVPAAHHHMGGIAVDACGRSSLESLWACGEAASTGVHGANRLASNSLLEALVFGSRVASDIVGGTEPPTRSADLERCWGEDFASKPSPLPHGEVADELRLLMWHNVGLVREAGGLERAVSRLRRLAGEVGKGEHVLRNRLEAALLVATAARIRCESRGGHFRSDFPAPDPAWKRRLYLRRDVSGRIRVEPAGRGVEVPDAGVGVA